MIHLLEVSPDITPLQLSKLARRYAMTGGYEIALLGNLDSAELDHLVDIYLPILAQQPRDSSRFTSCNAYRILKLVWKHSDLSSSFRARLDEILGDKG